MGVLIKGGRVIDPANGVNQVQDLYIENGMIAAVGEAPQDFSVQQTIDAGGQVVCPGLVDLRARLREPGHKHKGTIASETTAAVSAGITTLCCPPDTDPVIDSPAVVELIHRRAAKVNVASVIPLGAMTQGLEGHNISEMHALKQAGCCGVGNALQPVSNEVMRRAMEYAASHDLSVFLHAEDASLTGDGCAHEGVVSVRLGLPGIPESAETVAVSRELQLIELTGVRAHFCGISTIRAAQMIARAQYDGLPVTADVCAHQLFLTEMDIGYFNSQCHVRPPLRTQRDRDGLRTALIRGTVEAICSDHQPHDVDAKLAPFPSSEAGISALETLLPLTLRLVEDSVFSLPEAIARITHLPAEILGIDAGTLGVGARADVCIFDPAMQWSLNNDTIVSFGRNTPFMGWEFKGRVTHTLFGGRLVYQLGEST
jgi:dihydroorotase